MTPPDRSHIGRGFWQRLPPPPSTDFTPALTFLSRASAEERGVTQRCLKYATHLSTFLDTCNSEALLHAQYLFRNLSKKMARCAALQIAGKITFIFSRLQSSPDNPSRLPPPPPPPPYHLLYQTSYKLS